MPKKIIDFYDNYNDYIERNISITTALSWYCKRNNISDLYSHIDKDEIIKEYKRHFIDDINSSDDNIINNISLSSSNLSSNYYSNSSNEDDLMDNDNIIGYKDDNDDINNDKGNDDKNNKEDNKNKPKGNQKKR